MSNINIKPLGDRVLIELLSEENEVMTKSGIIIPETVDQEKPSQGTVVVVGPGKTTEEGKNIPVSLKEGQKVIFSRFGGERLKIENKEYYILEEDKILAVVE